jgi:hypothetical protein
MPTTRKQRQHEQRAKAERQARSDALTIKAALERYDHDLRMYRRLRRLGLAVREPDCPTDRATYRAAARRELARSRRSRARFG